MTSPVTKALIESYALMVMVMGTFFIYFCGMVWAFSNPKESDAEEEEKECVTGSQIPERRWMSAPASPRRARCTAETLSPSTYLNFCDDGKEEDEDDRLLSDSAALCLDHLGLDLQPVPPGLRDARDIMDNFLENW